jgi:hypothetical protein
MNVWTWIFFPAGGGVRPPAVSPATSMSMSQFDDDITLFFFTGGLSAHGWVRASLSSFRRASCPFSNSSRRGDDMIRLSAPRYRRSGPVNELCHGMVSVKAVRLELPPNGNPIFLKSGGSVAMHPAIMPSASSIIALIAKAL